MAKFLFFPVIFLYICCYSAFSQDRASISGFVRGDDGGPVAQASVSLSAENRSIASTITDTAGYFSFNNLSSGQPYKIGFTHVGYAAKTLNDQVIRQNGRLSLVVTLSVMNNTLDTTVIIGYGQQNKTRVTSAIGSFKPTEENRRAVLGPDQLLQGHVAGVNISSSTGSPGATSRVSIRGTGSLSATNEPLYVVDGVPVVTRAASINNMGESMSPLALLNPNDIESIEVLKDAASAAIYGSRATNGVVIITTKSGKQGASRFNIDVFAGVQTIPNTDKIAMADVDTYLTVINEAIDNYNIQNNYQPDDSRYMLRKENPFPGEPSTRWLDLVTRPAKMQSVSASYAGGSDKTKIYLSGNYLNQDGAILTQNFKKYTLKLNLSHKVYDWLDFGMNTTFSLSENSRVPGSNLGTSIMGRSVPQRPFDRPYKPDGEYYLGGTDELIYHNPMQILNEAQTNLDNYRFLGTIFANLKITDGLIFKTLAGSDVTYTEDNIYYNQFHPYGTGVGTKYDDRRFTPNYIFENTLSYTRKISGLNMDALLGYSYQKANFSSSAIQGSGFPTPFFTDLSVASQINSAGTSTSESALTSFFGRANLSWLNKYLLNLSLRADGSSRFHPSQRWGYFPSVSGGWNVSKEDFWQNHTIDLKIRGSYGETGNQDGISSYAYQAQMSGGSNYDNNSGIAVTTNGNRDLTWETARQYDFGMDLSLFKNKLNLTVDYFVKRTLNLLYDKPQPATTGFTSIITNVGNMENRGLELTIGGNVPIGKVNWSSDLNMSFVKNKVTGLLNDEPILIGANRVLKIGEEVGSYFLFRQLGIYQRDEDVPESFYNNGVRAGDVIYEDIDGNGIINVDDRQVVGSPNPTLYGGWNNSFTYGNFDLNLFFTYSYGNEVYSSWRITTERLGNNFVNITERVAAERWTGPGTSNTTPRAIYGSTWNLQNSSRFLEDGSFIRLRSLNFGYSLPSKWIGKLNVKRARLYFQGDNLLLWTKYRGMDPEVTSNLDPQFIGEDNLILPQLRVINFGLSVDL